MEGEDVEKDMTTAMWDGTPVMPPKHMVPEK